MQSANVINIQSASSPCRAGRGQMITVPEKPRTPKEKPNLACATHYDKYIYIYVYIQRAVSLPERESAQAQGA